MCFTLLQFIVKTFFKGFVIYCIGYIFMVLFANEHTHQHWCPKSDNSTDVVTPNFIHELCIEYILPTLIFT